MGCGGGEWMVAHGHILLEVGVKNVEVGGDVEVDVKLTLYHNIHLLHYHRCSLVKQQR